MKARRTFLQGLLASLGALTLTSPRKSTTAAEPAALVPLRDRAAAKGIFYGSATRDDLFRNRQYAKIFARECGMLVTEGAMKWRALRPTPTTYDFTKGDRYQHFAQQHKMLLRGHTLCWHGALPEWFASTVNNQNARQYLTDHISTVVSHYAGGMHSWDVLNEGISPQDGLPHGLRNSPWYQFLGPDYIELAFHTAAKADPKALLTYNDYGIEYKHAASAAKRDAVLSLLQRLKTRGVPVGALGIQSHLDYTSMQKSFDPHVFRQLLRDAAALGLKIIITELDVDDTALPVDFATRDAAVAKCYREFLEVVLEEPAVIGVLTWGLTDKYTWLSGYRPRKDGQPVRPLLLDAQMAPKPAWFEVASAFDRAALHHS